MPRYREHILERIEAEHRRKETLADIQKELDELVGSYPIVLYISISLNIRCIRISQPVNRPIQIILSSQTSSVKFAICSERTKSSEKRCLQLPPLSLPLAGLTQFSAIIWFNREQSENSHEM